jgi:hypothetical protein
MTLSSPFANMVSQLGGTSLPEVPDALAEQLYESLDSAVKHLGSMDSVRVALSRMRSNQTLAIVRRGILGTELTDPLDPLVITKGLEGLSIAAWVSLNKLDIAVRAVNESASQSGAQKYVSGPIAQANRSAQANDPKAGKSGRPKGFSKKKLTRATIRKVKLDPDFKSYDLSDDKAVTRKNIQLRNGISKAEFYEIRNSK